MIDKSQLFLIFVSYSASTIPLCMQFAQEDFENMLHGKKTNHGDVAYFTIVIISIFIAATLITL